MEIAVITALHITSAVSALLCDSGQVKRDASLWVVDYSFVEIHL